tara:strand:+ start:153 stop:557 length:405 start_codon:yes stop_codon:yes gene_type:complete
MFPSLAFPRRTSFFLLCALFALMTVSWSSAADKADPSALPALPLTTSFGPGTSGENSGPYALTLKNTANHALTLQGTIFWSVTSHNRAQTLALGPKELAPGASWTINDLAFDDRIILQAKGFAKLELKTPPGKK